MMNRIDLSLLVITKALNKCLGHKGEQKFLYYQSSKYPHVNLA